MCIRDRTQAIGHRRGTVGILQGPAADVADQLDDGGSVQHVLWPLAGKEDLELIEVSAPHVVRGGELSQFVRRDGRRLLCCGCAFSCTLRRIGALLELSLIHISEPTRLGMISYAVF